DLITRDLPATIIISRKDWPEIRLTYHSMEAAKFQLEAGDRVKLEISAQAREDIAILRRKGVTLKAVDYPFEKILGVVGGKPVEAGIPTLIQALADTQVPSSSNWRYFAEEKTADLVKMYGFDALYGFTLLPHPDLANIRIRRLMGDGAQKLIEVNLAEIIAASTDQTTAEDAKKADVMLQPGDVVEISLLKDRLDEPWKGFSAKEEAFLAKALGGRFKVTDAQKDITVRDLFYNAPRFVETEIGWVPLPPETGIPTVRGSWLTRDAEMWVIRGDVESSILPPSMLFLRDGDEVWTQKGQPRPAQKR
ncbi:MAG TPA: hypothetical protein VLO11_14710, partial [Luteolibacter sp.]|nr:hypothetical protein [Luteolibacter sp.]